MPTSPAVHFAPHLAGCPSAHPQEAADNPLTTGRPDNVTCPACVRTLLDLHTWKADTPLLRQKQILALSDSLVLPLKVILKAGCLNVLPLSRADVQALFERPDAPSPFATAPPFHVQITAQGDLGLYCEDDCVRVWDPRDLREASPSASPFRPKAGIHTAATV